MYGCLYIKRWCDIKGDCGIQTRSEVQKNTINNNILFEEFVYLVSKQILLPGWLIFLGDFNILWNKLRNTGTMKFKDIIDSYEFSQYVH